MKTYIGIDNGTSGAIAALSPDDKFTILEPVKTIPLGRRLLLDIQGNLEILKSIAQTAGGLDKVVVTYEKQQMNRYFGTKGNFANGQNGEFWRVLLTLSGFSFALTHARTWQTGLLKAFRMSLPEKADTKGAAQLFLAQRYPNIKLDGKFNATQREGIRDAMCLALWARSKNI